jgi:hypothetical protein
VYSEYLAGHARNRFGASAGEEADGSNAAVWCGEKSLESEWEREEGVLVGEVGVGVQATGLEGDAKPPCCQMPTR